MKTASYQPVCESRALSMFQSVMCRIDQDCGHGSCGAPRQLEPVGGKYYSIYYASLGCARMYWNTSGMFWVSVASVALGIRQW